MHEALSSTAAPITDLKWRRHEQLRHHTSSALPDEERLARREAVRGLYAAHAGNLDEAVSRFTSAARCAAIDLSELPGFWTLSRKAMLAAVAAYESTDRLRDASALNARIRLHLRPHALPTPPQNVTEFPEREVSLTGNS